MGGRRKSPALRPAHGRKEAGESANAPGQRSVVVPAMMAIALQPRTHHCAPFPGQVPRRPSPTCESGLPRRIDGNRAGGGPCGGPTDRRGAARTTISTAIAPPSPSLSAATATSCCTFLIRFLGSRAAAEDVFQEAFVQVHLSADTFDRPAGSSPGCSRSPPTRPVTTTASTAAESAVSLSASIGPRGGGAAVRRPARGRSASSLARRSSTPSAAGW